QKHRIAEAKGDIGEGQPRTHAKDCLLGLTVPVETESARARSRVDDALARLLGVVTQRWVHHKRVRRAGRSKSRLPGRQIPSQKAHETPDRDGQRRREEIEEALKDGHRGEEGGEKHGTAVRGHVAAHGNDHHSVTSRQHPAAKAQKVHAIDTGARNLFNAGRAGSGLRKVREARG
ncbi:MAG: hypothetical protein ACK559_21430, partial [bacterium]